MTGFNITVFIGLTVILFGGASFMMGQAIAETWRPAWQNFAYGLLLTVGDRFLDGALFKGEWFSLERYILDAAVIIAIALLGYRITQARQMVSQYPWLYERSGLLSWRSRGVVEN